MSYSISRCKFEDVCININDKNKINIIYARFDNTFDFEVFKKNCFDCVYYYIILLINLENKRAISKKFLIHRCVMLIIFKKVYISI